MGDGGTLTIKWTPVSLLSCLGLDGRQMTLTLRRPNISVVGVELQASLYSYAGN